MKIEKVKRSLVMRKKLTKNGNKSLGGEFTTLLEATCPGISASWLIYT